MDSSKSFKVTIKDFQSIQKADLEIDTGVNVVVGKSNEGKTALIRAIDSSLFNLGDDSMIRGGQRYYGISVSNENHQMTMIRDGVGKNEKTRYQFDGGSIQKKVGRTQLPEVASMFNIREVKMSNGIKMKLNFWYQNDKPFLMDKTSGQLYEFLTLSSCDNYLKVLKKMIVDMKVQEAEINNITTEIDTLKSINSKKSDFVDANVGFDIVYADIIKLDSEIKSFNKIKELLGSIIKLKDRISDVKSKFDNVSRLSNLIPIDSLTMEFSSFISDCNYLDNVKGDIKSIYLKSNNISLVGDSLSKSRNVVNKLETAVNELKISLLDIGSVFGIVDGGRKYLRQIEVFSDRISSNSKLLGRIELYLSSVVSKEEFSFIENSYSNLVFNRSKINSVLSLFDKISKLQLDVHNNDELILKTDREFIKLKREVGYCPFCGTVFTGMSDEELANHNI